MSGNLCIQIETLENDNKYIFNLNNKKQPFLILEDNHFHLSEEIEIINCLYNEKIPTQDNNESFIIKYKFKE